MNYDLGPRLAVFDAIAHCDSKHEHETRLVTDGVVAYAYVTGNGGTDVTAVSRDGVTITAACPMPQPHSDEPCTGELTWRLDELGTWTGAAEALSTLERFGQPVEA